MDEGGGAEGGQTAATTLPFGLRQRLRLERRRRKLAGLEGAKASSSSSASLVAESEAEAEEEPQPRPPLSALSSPAPPRAGLQPPLSVEQLDQDRDGERGQRRLW